MAGFTIYLKGKTIFVSYLEAATIFIVMIALVAGIVWGTGS